MRKSKSYTHLLRGAAAAGFAAALLLGAAGCKSNAPAPIVNGNASGANGQDPADANLAQPYTGGSTGGYNTGSQNGGTQVLGASQAYEPQANGQSYYDGQNPAPIIQQYPQGAAPPPGQGYGDAEEAGEAAIAATDQAPPPLPEYDQPPAPDPNYMWTPGYWNYGGAGYYWVPGAWVAPPYYGALWTPPWWGYYGNHYMFHRGYWGPHVGYYGGINYGFGYIGIGYFGGYWHGHDFLYNRAVTNINPGMIHGYYDRPVVYNGLHYGPHPTDRVSYNGGRGGINVQPRPAEMAAMHEAHYAPVAAQRDLRMAAASNRGQAFASNGGHPSEAFAGHAVGARSNIAAAPHEQPFNHPGAPGAAARPGAPMGGERGVAGARPNTAPNMSPGDRPGMQPGRPNTPEARPGFNAAHGGAPAPRPGFAGGHPGNPGTLAGRPGVENRPAPAAHPGNPGFNAQRPAAPAARPAEPMRAAPIERPAFSGNRPAPAGRPEPAQQFHPAPAARPAPAPQFHPAPAARPEPAARPAPRPAPAARPAPAPHGEGGGSDHHH